MAHCSSPEAKRQGTLGRPLGASGDVLRVVPLDHLHVDDAVDVDSVEIGAL